MFPNGDALSDYIVGRDTRALQQAPIAHTYFIDQKQFCVIALWKGEASKEIFRRSFTTHISFNQIRDEDGDQ